MKLLFSPLLLKLPALVGGLVIHWLWPDRRPMAVLLKASLGIGLGLGISSILYFVSLLIAPGRLNMLAAQALLLLILVIAIARRERGSGWLRFSQPSLSRLQWGSLAVLPIAFIFSLLAFANLSAARPQGSFDAWGIWNRTARFIYRDPENWQATFSPNLFWLMHADYPLLVPLNVAWSWDVLGFETNRTPSMQSFMFLFGTLAVLFSATALLRTIAQGSLAALVLAGIPSLFFTGYGQIADVPVAYFVLSAGVCIHAGLALDQPRLLALSGFMAGLAAWTKNEGLAFAPAGLLAIVIADRKNRTAVRAYLAGLVIPAAVVLYFKAFLAPASEFAVGGVTALAAKALDPTRYSIILLALWKQLGTFAGWPVTIFLQLAVYAWLMRRRTPRETVPAARALAALITLQLLGYCAIYLLSPYDLQWHLDTSIGRLVMQLVPALIFLVFSTAAAPEEVFTAQASAPQG